MIAFTVNGIPAQQGSKKAFVVKGRAVVVDDNKGPLKTWRQTVQAAAQTAIANHPTCPVPAYDDGPLEVTVIYRMPRPQAHYGTRAGQRYLKPSAPVHVDRLPDIDKLDRAILDALTAAGMWRDDRQVARLCVEKVYADPGIPGADITVTTITPRRPSQVATTQHSEGALF